VEALKKWQSKKELNYFNFKETHHH